MPNSPNSKEIVTGAPVGLQNIMFTLLGVASITIPPTVTRARLLPLMRGEQDSWEETPLMPGHKRLAQQLKDRPESFSGGECLIAERLHNNLVPDRTQAPGGSAALIEEFGNGKTRRRHYEQATEHPAHHQRSTALEHAGGSQPKDLHAQP